ADDLQRTDGGRVGGGAPPLGNADWFEAHPADPTAGAELGSQVEGELLPLPPVRQPRVAGVVVGLRCVAEDDVVHRDAQVETTLVVEVNDLIRGVRRSVLAVVAECTAVTEGCYPWSRCTIEAEELADADTVEAMPLRDRILAGRAG